MPARVADCVCAKWYNKKADSTLNPPYIIKREYEGILETAPCDIQSDIGRSAHNAHGVGGINAQTKESRSRPVKPSDHDFLQEETHEPP